MSEPESTCWTVIEAAAAGCSRGRDEFVHRYAPVVLAYLAARWRSSPCLRDLDDAVQEVFVECFKQGGVLDRAQRGRGFRAYLCGVVRNIARRVETDRGRRRENQAPTDVELADVASDEESLSRVFDRAWARSLLREAARLQAIRAKQAGPPACRRVELLRLRFHEGLPIRTIAARWQADAAELHHEYARARQEFKAALLEVVAFHHPGSPEDIERECGQLLTLLE
jgi:RNA polymerase sigma-70 factor (ECF subfamily)